MLTKLKTLYLIIYMMLGGKCKYPNQKYLVEYRDGSFVVQSSGTLIGNLSKLEVHRGS